MSHPILDEIVELETQIEALNEKLDAARKRAVEELCPYKPGVDVEIQFGGKNPRGQINRVVYHSRWSGGHDVKLYIRMRNKNGTFGTRERTAVASLFGTGMYDPKIIEHGK